MNKQKQTHRRRKKNLCLLKRKKKGKGQIACMGLRDKTSIYKIENQQEYIIQHGESLPLSYNNIYWSNL